MDLFRWRQWFLGQLLLISFVVSASGCKARVERSEAKTNPVPSDAAKSTGAAADTREKKIAQLKGIFPEEFLLDKNMSSVDGFKKWMILANKTVLQQKMTIVFVVDDLEFVNAEFGNIKGEIVDVPNIRTFNLNRVIAWYPLNARDALERTKKCLDLQAGRPDPQNPCRAMFWAPNMTAYWKTVTKLDRTQVSVSGGDASIYYLLDAKG
jgi:hypothetical protein